MTMNNFFLYALLYTLSSCSFIIDISDSKIISKHIPDVDAPGNVVDKLRDTIWQQEETDPDRDIFLFIPKEGLRYFTMPIAPGKKPGRYPFDHEYISLEGNFPLGATLQPNQAVIFKVLGTTDYIGINLLNDKLLQVAFATGTEAVAVPQIQQTLETKTGQIFHLYI